MTVAEPGTEEFAAAGRSAAGALWLDGVTAKVEDPLHPTFAEAAIGEFSRLQTEDTPGIYRDVLDGAARGAEQLDVEPFHGVVEVLQNADDVGATELRLALRTRQGRRTLCFIHDGAPVRLPDVIAMSLAFVSTKGEDPFQKGRFGIGLKTLRALGSTLRVHSGPYHVGMSLTSSELAVCEPARLSTPLFDGPGGETLLELELGPGFDGRGFKAWLEGLDVSSLLFLDSVRTVSLAGSRAASPSVVLSLRAGRRSHTDLSLGRSCSHCEHLELRSPDGRIWDRYVVDRSVPRSAPKRRQKLAGATTPIGIAVPRHQDEQGRIFAGLPLGTDVRWPFSLNAQFDVDTPRTGIQRGEWNQWLLGRVVEAVVAIARGRFEAAPSSGWAGVPLLADIEGVSEVWLHGLLAEAVENIQRRAFRGLAFVIEGDRVPVGDLVYEGKALERLLTEDDLRLVGFPGVPLPRSHRDRAGRWRDLLADLGSGVELEPSDALELLRLEERELGERSVNWFIRLARVAIGAGDAEELGELRSVVLEDGSRATPTVSGDEGEVLVRRAKRSSLAHRLGLARVIHPAYLSRSPEAAAVLRWLEADGALVEATDDGQTLRALSRRGESGADPIPLADEDLIDLRSALMTMSESERTELGPLIGAAVTVDGFRWERGRQIKQQVVPAASYLPKTLEDRQDGWTAAAMHAPGPRFVAARYATALRRGSGRGRIPGPARLFRLLGAEVAPHIWSPEEVEYVYRDPANPIDFGRLTDSQLAALDGAHVTHSRGDRFSEDLASVVEDIRKDRSRRRRSVRSRALLATLDREWGRLYEDKGEAQAVVSDYGWVVHARMPASWLAVAADTAWLNTGDAGSATPRELVVRTPATEAMYGKDFKLYAADIDERLAASPAVRALGVATDPRVSEVIDQLKAIHDDGADPDTASLAVRYLALAAAIRRVDAEPEDMVGDVSVRRVRARFGGDPRHAGLIFAGGGWHRPREVFRGRPIFGVRRASVPEPTRAERLWRLLNVPVPDVGACVAVLEEIARDGAPGPSDEEVLCNVYGHLDSILEGANARTISSVVSIPLWTGSTWTRKRPLFVVEDDAGAEALAGRIPLWRPPLSLATIPTFVGHLDVVPLEEDRFEPDIDDADVGAGEPYRETVADAVAALRDDLARNDRELYRRLALSWDELAEVEVALPSGPLVLRLDLPGRRPVRFPARAHLGRRPPRLSCATSEELGARVSGGRAIASLFPPADRHKVAMAWAAAWTEAQAVERHDRVTLAEDGDTADIDDLYRQATSSRQRSPKRSSGGGGRDRPRKPSSIGRPAARVVRRLKSPESLRVASVERPTGTGRRVRRRRGGGLKDPPAGRRIESASPAPRGAPKAYSSEDLQQLALLALNQAINGELSDLRDFQHLRGIGADALDRTDRFFEIKSTAGAMVDQVILTPNEYRRAVEQGKSFFLAVVAGLEEGYDTVVRIIADPARMLEARRSQGLALSGILRVDKPIEVRFEVEGTGDEADG